MSLLPALDNLPQRPIAGDRRSRAHAGQPSQARGLRSITLAVLLLVCFASGGCTSLRQWARSGFKVGPNYARPAAPVAPDWIDSGTPRVQNDPVQDCAWWRVLNDPVLDGLIDSAYRQNLDLRAAGARILEARAQRNIAAGNLFPQSQSATAAYAHGQITQNLALPLPQTINVWATGFNASWELDFWGRYRRNVEAADADYAATIEDFGDTLVLLLSEVAATYVELRTAEERLVYANKNLEIQRGSLKLAEDRFGKGQATELDVRQARTSLAQTRATLAPLETSRRQASNRLCVLMGMPVDDLAARLPAAPIPQAPAQIAVGLPADLLRRRPDIRRAERQVAAQSARIGVAEADFYPRLSLNGFLGYAADDIEHLFAAKSFTGFILPTLQWNILNYGRIANNIVVQDARLREAALAYQQTVLQAGREVEDGLVAFVQAQQQAAALADSVREAERSVELVLIQFQGGITDFNRVYNTQTVLLGQQDQLASTRGEISLRLISVYKALGGGWRHVCLTGKLPAPQAVVTEAPAVLPSEEIPPGSTSHQHQL